jgi:hypothetical protein
MRFHSHKRLERPRARLNLRRTPGTTPALLRSLPDFERALPALAGVLAGPEDVARGVARWVVVVELRVTEATLEVVTAHHVDVARRGCRRSGHALNLSVSRGLRLHRRGELALCGRERGFKLHLGVLCFLHLVFCSRVSAPRCTHVCGRARRRRRNYLSVRIASFGPLLCGIWCAVS